MDIRNNKTIGNLYGRWQYLITNNYYLIKTIIMIMPTPPVCVRFYGSPSIGYYDPYYTNMYWYSYNPHIGCKCIYGYNFWWDYPYYRPYYYYPRYYHYGFYYNWGYDPYYNPYYNPYYHHHHDHHYGYYKPHHNNGHHKPHKSDYYYYNSYDNNRSYSYGHRGSIQGGVNATANRNGTRTPSNNDDPKNKTLSTRETQQLLAIVPTSHTQQWKLPWRSTAALLISHPLRVSTILHNH